MTTYFDTDVLVHYFFPQDLAKQAIAQRRIRESLERGEMVISVLSLQELAFVLTKLKAPPDDVRAALSVLKKLNVRAVTSDDFLRAEKFVPAVGFQSINDCLHTALAERYCEEFVTFNHSDFRKIEPLSTLKISLL